MDIAFIVPILQLASCTDHTGHLMQGDTSHSIEYLQLAV